MEQQGFLKKLCISNWAASIVAVPKKEGAVLSEFVEIIWSLLTRSWL